MTQSSVCSVEMSYEPIYPDHTDGWSGRRFRRGFTYPFRGLKMLLTHTILWPYVLIPAIIMVTAVVMAGIATFSLTPSVMNAIWQPGAEYAWYWQWAWFAFEMFLALTIFLIVSVALYFTAGFLALPFNDRLSDRVEGLVLGRYDEEFDWKVVSGDLWVSMYHTVFGLMLWAVVMFGVLLLNLIPVVGSIASFVIGLVATSFFLGREMMDGCMSRRRMGFVHKLKVVRGNLATMQGFGIATYGMLWIPGLNFVSLPCAVIGGTILYCELELQGLVPDADGKGHYIPDRSRIQLEDQQNVSVLNDVGVQ